jgi:asparagine synthase (glutamine-hydrolysing)
MRMMIVGPLVRTYLPLLSRWRPQPKPWLHAEHLSLFQEISHPPSAPRAMLPGRIQRLQGLSGMTMNYVAEHQDRRTRVRHGIDLRHPLLDHRLVDFALTLPTTQTFRAGQRKIIVRNAMRGILPGEIVEMWGKIYPTTISERGLREREQAKVWALLTNMRAAELGLVDEARLRQAYQDFLDHQKDEDFIWYTLTLEDWLRRYF